MSQMACTNISNTPYEITNTQRKTQPRFVSRNVSSRTSSHEGAVCSAHAGDGYGRKHGFVEKEKNAISHRGPLCFAERQGAVDAVVEHAVVQVAALGGVSLQGASGVGAKVCTSSRRFSFDDKARNRSKITTERGINEGGRGAKRDLDGGFDQK